MFTSINKWEIFLQPSWYRQFQRVGFFIALFWIGFLWMGMYFVGLYFLRKQRDSSFFLHGMTCLFAGMKLGVFHYFSSVAGISFPDFLPEGYLKIYLTVSVVSSYFLLLTILSYAYTQKHNILSGFFSFIFLLTGMLIVRIQKTNLIFLIFRSFEVLVFFLSLSIFLLLFSSRNQIREKWLLILLSMSVLLSFFPSWSRPVFELWSSGCQTLSILILIYLKSLQISSYFSEVEDLTYDLKVINASLKKSEMTVKKVNEQLQYQANHDFLTNLPNRMSLYNMAEKTLQDAFDRNHKVGFLLLDLDRFKQLNDTMGHQMGDRLLSLFSERIRSILRSSDYLYRLGGDEFTIIAGEIHDKDDLVRIIDKIYRELECPVSLGDVEYRVSSSIGAALFPDHGKDIDTLMGKADIALYGAKESGRNRSVFFHPSMQDESDSYFHMHKKMTSALENNRFTLYFQPQFITGNPLCLYGYETLVRLKDSRGTIIPPSRFIPIAEDSGFILPLGNWILDRACEISKKLLKENPSLAISVNISPIQFRSETFLKELLLILQRHDFPPRNLIIELTESLVMDKDCSTLNKIREIRDLGIKISIDDFGTGFSSLNYLKEFPLDHLKIDRSFISGLPESKPDKAIVKSIIEMSDSLGMTVVAEGIENSEQLAFLQSHGCHLVQGFLTGRPVPGEEIVPGWCSEESDFSAKEAEVL